LSPFSTLFGSDLLSYLCAEGADMEPSKDLEKMTVKELRELAHEIEGLEGVSAMKKEDLLIAIKRQRGIEGPRLGPRRATAIHDLKHHLREFRSQREGLLADRHRDRRRLKSVRRHIKYLKRKMRRIRATAGKPNPTAPTA
jgi:uncharacterized NAD-dependent epimerase/dehydratase family protein